MRATTTGESEAHVRALLLQAISGHAYQLRALESADIARSDLVEVRAEPVTSGRNDQQIEVAAGRLGLEPNITSVRWQVVHDELRGLTSDSSPTQNYATRLHPFGERSGVVACPDGAVAYAPPSVICADGGAPDRPYGPLCGARHDTAGCRGADE